MSSELAYGAWYIIEILDLPSGEFRQRYPHGFLTKEVAEAFLENRKHNEAFKDSRFELIQEPYNQPAPPGSDTFDKD